MAAKNSKMELSEKATVMMKDIIMMFISGEEKIEVLRQFLVSNEFFDLYSAFNRIDRDQDGFISPLEFLNFFRDNGVTHLNEANCYFMVKFFDSDFDGKLHFADFMQMVLPCTNSKMRSEVTQRTAGGCKPDEYLTMDVEQDLSRLLKMEAELHDEVEPLK